LYLLMQQFLIYFKIIISLALLLTLAACNTTKYLQEDQYLLKKNTIKIITEEKIKNKTALTFELSKLYQQQPNTNFLFFFPREWFYFATADSSDTTRFDRWQRRVIGEVPAIYQEELADSTARSMEYYLHYNGYYNARVVPDDRIRGKRAKVVYFVYPYQQFTIDSVFFSSQDTGIARVLQELTPQSLLQPGLPLTRTLYEQERERISSHLRNNGYAYFYPNYIAPVEADTTVRAKKLNVYLEVLEPAADSNHRQYRVGDITVYTQYDPAIEQENQLDTLVDGVRFLTPGSYFRVKPQAINKAIFLRKGDLYSQENYDKTVRQLTALGVYKFVRVQEEMDSVERNVLDFRIELTRNPRLEIGADFEVNYTNRGTAAVGNLIGLSVSPSLRNRNLLRGAELLVTNLGWGVEVNPNVRSTSSRFWNTIDARVQSELLLPRFSDYLGVWRGLNSARVSKKSGLVTDDFYQLLRESGNTRLSASYNYLLILDFYSYNFFNATYGYDVRENRPRANNRYLINHIGVDFLRPDTFRLFRPIVDANPFLQRSFGKQLFVSLLFRDFTFTHTTRPNQAGVSHYVGLNVEAAGAEIWAVNYIYNAFALDGDTFRLRRPNDATDFSQYVKLEGSYHLYRTFTPKTGFAGRISVGIARPFGYTTDVPYVKQFFVGGPNSIRGWAIRELGPGGYVDTLSLGQNRARNRLLFYQTGDLKLEFNLEYRFPLFSLLNGAIFLDGGNVWTLQRDPDRPGSQFLLGPRPVTNNTSAYQINDAFYKQIALNTGFGIRLDLSYFIIRLDAGVKLRSPYPLNINETDVNAADYWYKFKGWGINDVNFNLGLGYPF